MSRRAYRLKEAKDPEMYNDHVRECVICGSTTENLTTMSRRNAPLVQECKSCGTRVEWDEGDQVIELHTEQDNLDSLEGEYLQYTWEGIRY